MESPQYLHSEFHYAQAVPQLDFTQTPAQDNLPDYGRRLLPQLVDQLAKEDPNGVYLRIPNSADYSDGLTTITYSHFARAVNRAAWWLESQFGKPDEGTHPVFAFMSINGPLYFVIAVASMKVGMQVLFPSPRNSLEGQLHLIDATKCVAFVKDDAIDISDILAERDIRCITISTFRDFSLGQTECEPYPWHEKYDNVHNTPTIILHSSGSTGPPKPIALTHGTMCTIDSHHYLPEINGYKDFIQGVEGLNLYCPMPTFHAAGCLLSFITALYYKVQVNMAPIEQPLNISTVEHALNNGTFDGAVLPPSLVEEISKEPSMLKKIEHLGFIAFTGGPLSQEPGDIVAQHTSLVSVLGSTECGVGPWNYTPLGKDWNYLVVNENMKGVQMQPHEDGFYEMVITRDEYTNSFHSTFYTFPNHNEYFTKDLFVRHPTKPHLYQHRARTDDVIVLSNGEKVVPIPMENQIALAPQVRSVIVLGHARFETAALVELFEGAPEASLAENIKNIAGYIERANASAPAHAKLSHDRILFTSPNKPMVRAAKGTVIRKATLKFYEKEIEDMYAGNGDVYIAGLPLLEGASVSDTEKALVEVVESVVGKKLETEQDFFASGIDSLQVLQLVRQLKGKLGQEQTQLTLSTVTLGFIYANPTIGKLAKALHSAANKGLSGDASRVEEELKNIQEMLTKYSHDLPHKEDAKKAFPTCPDDKYTVLLTGSTGSMGSYMLDLLLADPKVELVYCLNRSVDGEEKQKKSSGGRGLNTNWGDKAVFLHTQTGEDKFALDDETYNKLLDEVSYVIHNQWPVDFNQTLASFEPHVHGVRSMVDLSFASKKHTPILFTSTISTTTNWLGIHPETHLVPEEVITDFHVPEQIGYGQSKYVGERLLEAASDISGVKSTICRVGQVAGPVDKLGVWNRHEWFPTLLASSKEMGILPNDIGAQGTMDWIPVDLLARVIVELMHADLDEAQIIGSEESATPSNHANHFYHLVNPKKSSWAAIVPFAAKRLSTPSKPVSLVTYSEWLGTLSKAANEENVDAKKNPAIKLVDFYEDVGRQIDTIAKNGGDATAGGLDTRNTAKRSETLNGLPAVGEDWMGKWLDQWAF